MLFLTRLFGVTGSDAERNLVAEPSLINEIVEKVLLLQANSAAQQKRPLGRGTHVKGTTARAQFEVFDINTGRETVLAARLAKGIFAKPGIYPAIVRFGNADPKINSDFKADVRSLSFSVEPHSQRHGCSRLECYPARFLAAERDDSAHKRRTWISRDHEAADGIAPRCRLVVSAVERQVASVQDSCARASTGAPENQAISEAALLEQRAVSSRIDRRCEAVGHTPLRQPCAASRQE